MNRMIPVLGVAALAFSAGCRPNFLIGDYFIPDTNKVVRATQAQSGLADQDGNTTVTYAMQICDLNDGKATNCKKTVVLTNVLAVQFWNRGY